MCMHSVYIHVCMCTLVCVHSCVCVYVYVYVCVYVCRLRVEQSSSVCVLQHQRIGNSSQQGRRSSKKSMSELVIRYISLLFHFLPFTYFRNIINILFGIIIINIMLMLLYGICYYNLYVASYLVPQFSSTKIGMSWQDENKILFLLMQNILIIKPNYLLQESWHKVKVSILSKE